MTVGSTARTTPFTLTVIQGSANTASAVTPQGQYDFTRWSDNGAQTHVITAPATATTYTATYTKRRLAQSAITVRSYDSQETVDENAPAVRVLDGNPATFWHTEWGTVTTPHPHEIVLDLGASRSVTDLYYLPRQNASNGRIAAYEVYVSTDGTTWGTAVATGTFPNTTAEQTVSFAAKTGRYVRLRALSEVQGRAWTSVAELNVSVG